MPCGKEQIERLGAVYRNPLESHLSIQTLEGFFDAPKPQQIVFGDGSEDCVKPDAIRCRSNALIHNIRPLPVASIVDVIQPYDPRLAHDPYDLSVDAMDLSMPRHAKTCHELEHAKACCHEIGHAMACQGTPSRHVKACHGIILTIRMTILMVY